ncbi:hypothetical protein EYF80_059084 [Liparis tanakae]|uniref:Uncharacterized protein n=1 Tax=Liparis tanakae TaxID=230148 RepID=A0A4Z2ER45_9TELE|nr:hypothetical protein EYF80_059084 [Liparis tanakae]
MSGEWKSASVSLLISTPPPKIYRAGHGERGDDTFLRWVSWPGNRKVTLKLFKLFAVRLEEHYKERGPRRTHSERRGGY